MVIAECVQIERGPHLLGVGVVGLADVGLCETTVEGRLGRQLRLLQPCRGIYVVVRIDALPFQQLGVVGVGLEVDESIARQVGHQLLQRGRHELEAVDEAQPAERERDVLRHVVGDHVDASGVATKCWGDEVGVVSPQVVHDDGDLHAGPALRLLPLEMQP